MGYRYGQVRSCYIYRLVTDGSLERKIYDRQINKQGMSNRIVDEMNPDAYLHSKDIHSLLCLEEDEPRGNICKQSGKSKELDPDAFKDIDSVLSRVLKDTIEETTAQPFTHESLLIDRKEKSLSKAEKRMAERSYKIERGARISYKRTSYADFYPQSSSSQSSLNSGSLESYGSTHKSFNNIPNIGLNLKRNSYAAFYNNQGSNIPQNNSSSLLNTTNNKLSQLYNGIKSPDESATLVHPVWPAPQKPSCYSSGPYMKESTIAAVQQKVPPYYVKENVRKDGDQERHVPENQDNQSQGSPSTPFPFKELPRQGVNIKEIIIKNDMSIPTNSNTIPLKAGQKVMLIQTPKGIYLRMGEKIIKIKLPLSLLSSLTSSSDLEQIIPQMAIAENPTINEDNQARQGIQNTNGKPHKKSGTTAGAHELVNLLSSDEDESKKHAESTGKKDLET